MSKFSTQTGLVGVDRKLAIDAADGLRSAMNRPVGYSAKWQRSGAGDSYPTTLDNMKK